MPRAPAMCYNWPHLRDFAFVPAPEPPTRDHPTMKPILRLASFLPFAVALAPAAVAALDAPALLALGRFACGEAARCVSHRGAF